MEIKQDTADSTNRKNGFHKHPSVLLNNLYKQKNHQGADPQTANVLFLGRDPNWAIDVENPRGGILGVIPSKKEY